MGESVLYKVNAVEYRKKVPNLFYIDIKDNTDMTYQAGAMAEAADRSGGQ